MEQRTYGFSIITPLGQITFVNLAKGTAETFSDPALTDFVRESNAGDRVWFVPDMAALEARLATLG